MKRIVCFTIVILACLATNTIQAQSISSVKIKVLLHELELLNGNVDFRSDSIRIENLNQIALYQSNSSLDSALATLKRAELIADKPGFIDLEAVTHYNGGQVYEQHGDFSKSEKSYLEWFNIRKNQDVPKCRWAMTGMREFYSRHLQFEKLEEIDNEWVQLLDGQLARGEEPLYGYEASMLAVVDNLVDIGEYYKAESYFLHLLEMDAKSVYWLDGSMFYFRIERYLLEVKDVETLKDWYTRWFDAMRTYEPDQSIAIKTMSNISSRLRYKPILASQLLGHLHEITLLSKSGVTIDSYIHYWIPMLNVAAAKERVNKTGDPVLNRFIKYAIIFNTYVSVNSPLVSGKKVEGMYLKGAVNAAKSFHTSDGVDISNLITYIEDVKLTSQDKKVQKAMKKMIKKIKKL
ncbi:MAG: tetratricopeptide (TPR) repeat protein [Bacteroidia bacterium]